MENLIATIDEIVKYGLIENLSISDNGSLLEKHLVKLYNQYFELSYECDDLEYPKFDSSMYENIRKNISTNFKDFGFYLTIHEIENVYEEPKYLIGDAIDDLSDIILDLLEVRWRIENNSINNGYEFFKWIFSSHTQEHVLNLLRYIKYKDNKKIN